MREKIIEMILDINPFVDISENTNLISEEIIDSLGIMVLIEELEKEFEIEIDMSEIELKDFSNIESIIKLIGKKR